jgi:hypothetical protein
VITFLGYARDVFALFGLAAFLFTAGLAAFLWRLNRKDRRLEAAMADIPAAPPSHTQEFWDALTGGRVHEGLCGDDESAEVRCLICHAGPETAALRAVGDCLFCIDGADCDARMAAQQEASQ